MVALAEGYSSQAIQNPPCPSAASDAPCEYTEPGTFSVATGGTEAGPLGNTAMRIGEVTPTPVQEPYRVHATNTRFELRATAGLSWKAVSELGRIS